MTSEDFLEVQKKSTCKVSKQESWESWGPFRSETWTGFSNKKLSIENNFRHKMVCGHASFGLSGEEVNITKTRTVEGQFQQGWKRKERSIFSSEIIHINDLHYYRERKLIHVIYFLFIQFYSLCASEKKKHKIVFHFFN